MSSKTADTRAQDVEKNRKMSGRNESKAGIKINYCKGFFGSRLSTCSHVQVSTMHRVLYNSYNKYILHQ